MTTKKKITPIGERVYKIFEPKSKEYIAVSSNSRKSQTVWTTKGKAKMAGLKWARERSILYKDEVEQMLHDEREANGKRNTYYLLHDKEKLAQKNARVDKFENTGLECHSFLLKLEGIV